MWLKKKKCKMLEKSINKINEILEKANIVEISYILGNKKEIIIRNFIAGIFRGIGIGIGVTVITAIIILILQRIVTLNIPVIGKYLNDIIEIVQKSK